MAKKNGGETQSKLLRVLTRTLCDCGGKINQSSIVHCTVPQANPLPREYNVSKPVPSRELIDKDDIQDLMRLLSMGKGGGAKVDVDSEGNIVLKKSCELSSYSGGVGKIGRIDEEKSCSFNENDFDKYLQSRSRNSSFNRRI